MGIRKQQVIVIGGGETFDTHEDYIRFLKEDIRFDPLRYSTRKQNWKENLGKDLGRRFEVLYVSMPNKLNAKYEEWRIYFNKIVPHLRDGVIFVGHSLGGLFILKWLDEYLIPVKVGGTMLVSTPLVSKDYNDMGYADFGCEDNERTPYNNYGSVHIFQSSDDTTVDSRMADALSLVFPDATRHDFSDRGHFVHDTHFCELVSAIRSVPKHRPTPASTARCSA